MLERRRDLAHTLDRLDNALLVVGVVVVAILVIGLIIRFFARRR